MVWASAEKRRLARCMMKYTWRLVFAWWPVALEGDRWCWLQRYYRRWQDFAFHPGGRWERVLPGEQGTPRLMFVDRPNNSPLQAIPPQAIPTTPAPSKK